MDRILFRNLALSALCITGFIGFINYRSNTDRLFSEFNYKFQNQMFDEIYDDSAKHVRSNISKKEFVGRISDAYRKLKAIDSNIIFHKDTDIEYILGSSSTKYVYSSYQTIGEKGKEVIVTVRWTNEGINPQFSDLAVIPGNSEMNKYRVSTVIYKESSQQ